MLNVQVIGNLGSDVAIREFNGKKYVAFSVIHEKFTRDSQGNKVKVPVWISVLWYDEGRNVSPLLKPEVKVFVHGREDVKMYDDKAGNKRVAINVEASEVFLCGMKGEGNQQATPAQSNSTAAPTPTSSDNPADNLPFQDNQTMKYDIIMAIGPDTEESGVARLDAETRSLDIQTLPSPELLDYLQCVKEGCAKNGESLIVLVEAGWLVGKSNYHNYQSRRAEKIAKSVGLNHETGRKVIKMCKHYRAEVLPHFPLKKHWKGKEGKITHEELAYFTGIKKRTNQDARDAALLAWNFAGFPIYMEV